MVSIIRHLIILNQLLISKVNYLLYFIASNSNFSNDIKPFSPKYKKLIVDKPPVIKVLELLDYKKIINDHFERTGKLLKPVSRRKVSSVPITAVCTRCNAPHNYIYDNNGSRGQLWCKVCDNKFDRDSNKFKVTHITCAYCGSHLVHQKSRTNFNIHICKNNKCSYYLNSLKSLSSSEFEEFKNNPHRFKVRYIYREFTVDFFMMDIYSLPKGASSLQFRKFSPHIMGLCLTYLVNCNLSTRVAARVMREVHGVSISHVHISNMAKTAAVIVKPFVDDYDYNPSNKLVADETYIKTRGVKNYVWFVLDACKKSILGYTVSNSRSLKPCMKSMRMAFDKFKVFPELALKFISDGYPVYNLALNEFYKVGMPFNLFQVFGLTNDDPVSKEYRSEKQIVERFNRTYKASYRITCGFKSEEGSDIHLVLFVAFYNFLRPHSYTYQRPLNLIPELEKAQNMPAKWQILIELSQKHILNSQIPA